MAEERVARRRFALSLRAWIVAIALVSFAIVVMLACGSASSAPASSTDINATSACVDAGNMCVPEPGYHSSGGCQYAIVPLRCSDNFECCPVYPKCGGRDCMTGNTCDSDAEDYCSGVRTTPNCGKFACVGACTCADAGDGCDCPQCQEKFGDAAAGCTGSGQRYFRCVPDFPPPANAGTCNCDYEGSDRGSTCCCDSAERDE
ncbi:MAG: hypothetical protein ACRELY_09985 [Polyangiaceae bacterium]